MRELISGEMFPPGCLAGFLLAISSHLYIVQGKGAGIAKILGVSNTAIFKHGVNPAQKYNPFC